MRVFEIFLTTYYLHYMCTLTFNWPRSPPFSLHVISELWNYCRLGESGNRLCICTRIYIHYTCMYVHVHAKYLYMYICNMPFKSLHSYICFCKTESGHVMWSFLLRVVWVTNMCQLKCHTNNCTNTCIYIYIRTCMYIYIYTYMTYMYTYR